MSQYAEGSVSVTSGSEVITGVDTEWTSYVQPGYLFTIRRTGVVYQVASVDADDQLTLVAPYGGLDGEGLPYIISGSFTPNLRLPYPEPRDVEAVTILKEALSKIDGLLSATASPAVHRFSEDVTLDPTIHRNAVIIATGEAVITLPSSAQAGTGWRTWISGSVASPSGDQGPAGMIEGYVLCEGPGAWITYG